MVMPKVETREAGAEEATQVATPTVSVVPTVKPEAGAKIYSQAEADGLLTVQYNKLNTTLSQQGVELAKLRPMEAENETLRTRVHTLEDEADTMITEGVRSNVSELELQTGKRQLRVDRRTHEDAVRGHNVNVAAFGVKEAKYNDWNDQHNLENESSIASIAAKYKVNPDALKDIPKEGREAVAKALAGTQPSTLAPPVITEPVVPSLIENGLGLGGQQLTGDAAAAAVLAKAREKQRNQ